MKKASATRKIRLIRLILKADKLELDATLNTEDITQPGDEWKSIKAKDCDFTIKGHIPNNHSS